MSTSKHPHSPPDEALWYLSLGGAGEIGMNLSLYGTQGKWLMVDCGVTFGDDTTPGVDVIMADASFIIERKDDLVGLVLTHGHEDHIGAIEHLWPQLQCPIYATKFTAEFLRNKLGYTNYQRNVKIHEIPTGGNFEVGPFKGEYISVTHSIPEAQMLILRTKNGTVLHTGDWKLDPDPVLGNVSDTEKLRALGEEGLMAVIGDSTNATVPGRSGSEMSVQKEFFNLFPTIEQRIVVTCFASNIARLKSIAAAAKRSGRYVTLVGRSLWRNAEVAEECGYLPEFNDFLSENEAMLSPRNQIVIVATGSQGEPRAALCRIAVEAHPEVELDSGDTVIFSSRVIPGNEKEIAHLQNNLIAKGMHVITSEDNHAVHVSGHPAQEEVRQLYQWTKPHLVVPVHGETRHQNANAQIAKECDVPHTLVAEDGKIIRLGPGIHEVVCEVKNGRWALDGKVLRHIDHNVAKDRKKLAYSGASVVTLVMDAKGKVVRDPQVSLMGLIEGEGDHKLQGILSAIAQDAVEQMPKSTRIDDAAVRHAVSAAVRKHINEVHGKKPVMDVHVVRV